MSEPLKSPESIKLAENEVICLGTFEAGWYELIAHHNRLGHIVYDVSNLDIRTFDKLLQETSNSYSIYLKYANTKKNMVNIVNSIFLTKNDEDKVTSLLNCLNNIQRSQNLLPISNDQKELKKMITTLVQQEPNKKFTEYFAELANRIFSSAKKKILTEAQESVIKNIGDGYVNNSRYSKGVIATALQANIERFFTDKPLIPIEMVFMKHDLQDGSDFKGDFQRVKDKQGLYFSSQELRLIYRLMHEIPDATIRQIMQETFSLKELIIDKDGNKIFKSIQNPWDLDSDAWKGRTRTEHKKPYYARKTRELPPWIKKLLEFKGNCEKTYEASITPKKKVTIQALMKRFKRV